MVTQSCEYIKIFQTTHFRKVNFTVCELALNKAVINIKKKETIEPHVSPLNSRLVCPTQYLTFLPGYLVGTSNLTYPKLKSQHLPKSVPPRVFSNSVNANLLLPVAQAKKFGAICDSCLLSFFIPSIQYINEPYSTFKMLVESDYSTFTPITLVQGTIISC